MPWEKSFDTDQATSRAMHVFWSKGYEATSLADLLSATGINKGSFYNAFGSKKSLFVRTLLKYDRDERRVMLDELRALDDPVKAIKSVFDRMIAQSLEDTEKKGCFLVNTALDLPHHDEEIARTVQAGFDDLEDFFRGQLQSALRSGAIPAHVNAKETAKGLLSLTVGLRVLARGVFDPASLKAVRKQAMHLLT